MGLLDAIIEIIMMFMCVMGVITLIVFGIGGIVLACYSLYLFFVVSFVVGFLLFCLAIFILCTVFYISFIAF